MRHWSSLVLPTDCGDLLYPDDEHRIACQQIRDGRCQIWNIDPSEVDFEGVDIDPAEEAGEAVAKEIAACILFAARVRLLELSESKSKLRRETAVIALSTLRNHGSDMQRALVQEIRRTGP